MYTGTYSYNFPKCSHSNRVCLDNMGLTGKENNIDCGESVLITEHNRQRDHFMLWDGILIYLAYKNMPLLIELAMHNKLSCHVSLTKTKWLFHSLWLLERLTFFFVLNMRKMLHRILTHTGNKHSCFFPQNNIFFFTLSIIMTFTPMCSSLDQSTTVQNNYWNDLVTLNMGVLQAGSIQSKCEYRSSGQSFSKTLSTRTMNQNE